MGVFVGPYMNQKVPGVITNAGPTVVDKFASAQGYAQTAFNEAISYMNSLEALLKSIPDVDTSEIGSIEVPTLDEIQDNIPSVGEVSLPDIPDNDVIEPEWKDVDDIELPDISDMNINPPDVDVGSMPQVNIPDIPDAPSIDTNVDIPASPDATTPVMPSIPDIEFPSAPVVIMPEFGMELPNVDWDLPKEFNYTEAIYASDIWATLLHKVLTNISNGGTGLDATVEQDIYNRALVRQETENERLYTEAENYFEARGYSLPPGALSGRLAEISREISRNNTDLSEKITISQAELAQKNTQFFIDKGIQLEGMLRDFFNKQAQRTLTASTESARIGIEVINTAINTYNAKVAKFNAYTNSFEARTRAAVIELENYKTKIEACGVKAAVQRNIIEIYNSQLHAVLTKVDIYKTQIAGVNAKLEVQRTAIAAYQSQVQAYVANMEGNRIKYEIYNTKLKAAQVKTGIYETKVRAYVAKTEAANVKADVALKKATSQLQQNQSKIDIYKAKLAGYISIVQTTAEKGNMLLKSYNAEIAGHTALREDYVARSQVKIEANKVKVENARIELQKVIAEIQQSIENLRVVKGLQTQATSGIMNAAAQLAASALNSVTASAHLGSTSSSSLSDAFTHNASIYESHPYKEVE